MSRESGQPLSRFRLPMTRRWTVRGGRGILRRMRICFFGDSFVNGTGDPECLGWAGRICAAARRGGRDLTYYNLGVRRDTAEDLAHRWQDEAAARLPADVDGRLVFSFGVNDCIEDGRPPASAAATLAHTEAMVTKASRRWPTLFIGPPPIADDEVNQRIAGLSTSLKALCRTLAVPYLDLLSSLRTTEVWRREVTAGDGAHPGAEGYAFLADLVDRWRPWQSWMVASL